MLSLPAATSIQDAIAAGTSASSIRRWSWWRVSAHFAFRALNARGEMLLETFRHSLAKHEHVMELKLTDDQLKGAVAQMPEYFPEEERSKQPTIFSVLRALVAQMRAEGENHLGFYGALGYDLVLQFEPLQLRHPRREDRPDLHLFLPDELVVVDHRKEQARRYRYEFAADGLSTEGMERSTDAVPYVRGAATEISCDHAPGEYADKVREVIAGTERGDFFEVTPSQVLSAGYAGSPHALFANIRRNSPSPYEFFINLGDEYLIGASPEMFVRVNGSFVETCPIAGTIGRGKTVMEDAEQIRDLLNSKKDRGRAEHVYGRRSQRQSADLQGRLGAGGRAADDRKVLKGLSHCGPSRGRAEGRLRRIRRSAFAYGGR